MSLLRWLPTVVGFPLGGLAAIQVASTADGPLSAALAGVIAGAVIGVAQWLALRPRASSLLIAVTTAGLALGAGVAVAVTGGATDAAGLAVQGAISGAILGASQGVLLRLPIAQLGAWVATMGGSWALGWFITAAVIVDEQRGFVVFGLSGAAVVTLATGAVLRALLGARTPAVVAVTA